MELMHWIEKFRKCNAKRKDPNSAEHASVATVKSSLGEIENNYSKVLLTNQKYILAVRVFLVLKSKAVKANP